MGRGGEASGGVRRHEVDAWQRDPAPFAGGHAGAVAEVRPLVRARGRGPGLVARGVEAKVAVGNLGELVEGGDRPG